MVRPFFFVLLAFTVLSVAAGQECPCVCRNGRRARQQAFRECRRTSGCRLFRCNARVTVRGWECCDGEKINLPPITITASPEAIPLTPEITTAPTPAENTAPIPEETTAPSPEETTAETIEETAELTPQDTTAHTPEKTSTPTAEEIIATTPEETFPPTPEVTITPTPEVTLDVTTTPTLEDTLPPTLGLTTTPSIEVTTAPTPEETVMPSAEASPYASLSPRPFPLSRGVRCGRECGVCVAAGCHTRPGGRDNCCPGRIRRTGKACSQNPPPCIIDA